MRELLFVVEPTEDKNSLQYSLLGGIPSVPTNLCSGSSLDTLPSVLLLDPIFCSVV
ncbi:unnamed protein product [Schistosoma curassoni]|uniref:Uncharacterized protein n=1 Tax=Schistosoma curassoni TaxID=6186 RepID=A0A183KR96_9TREM|nr:unnamed protein product [Schistosoma curassoni]